MLGNAHPEITPEASQMMLKTGMENLAALLEELGLRRYICSHHRATIAPELETTTTRRRWLFNNIASGSWDTASCG